MGILGLSPTVVKWVGVLVGILALAAAGAWEYHRIWEGGYTAGQEHTQVLWDKDKIAIQQTADQAIARAHEDTVKALVNNQRIQDEYQTKLGAINAGNTSLARRLRDAEDRAAADRSALQKAYHNQGSSPPSQAPSNGSLDGAIAAALTECKANGEQLDSLIGEVEAQL